MLFRNSNKIRNETLSLPEETFIKLFGEDIEASNVSGKNSLKEVTVYACFKILCENIGKLPIKIYKKNKQIDHYLNTFLKLRPNSFMNAISFKKCMEFNRLLYGNSYAYISYKKNGFIEGIYPIDPNKVTILVDDKGMTNKKIWYLVNTKDGQIKVPFDKMIHLKALSSDGIAGISPITYLKNIIENSKASQDYVNKFYKNGMQTKGIIQYVGDLSEDAEKTFRTKFEQMSNGLENAHKVSLLPIGYQYQAISQKLADAQFNEVNNLTIKQITSAFGIKLHQINDLSSSTHTNITEQQKQFYIDTLQPILTDWEQELIFKILRLDEIESNVYIKFNVDSILRADIKTRYESYRIAIQSGFKTPNEVRKLEDDEPLEGGDKLMCNGNFIPVTDVGNQYNKGGE